MIKLDSEDDGPPPPPFDDGLPPTLLQDPPPDFAPYDANYFEVGYGDIVSHDPHLNSDGEALYRFLLSQAATPPSLLLHCRGTHTEHRTRWVSDRHNTDGHVESRTETSTETITDFDFYIDASPPPGTKPIHWTPSDQVPAYRGRMVREIGGGLLATRTARQSENKTFHRWANERTARGLPPWTVLADNRLQHPQAPEEIALKSSKTIRQWADEYCASPKYLKEFTYDKVIYGWSLQSLETAVRALIISGTMYRGHLEVNFETRRSKIFVRPDNRLSRMLSNKWLKLLSIITLVFPFIWLFKRFHSRGGGRWEVCGGAYPLKRSIVHPELLDHGPGTSTSITQIQGVKEGEWLRRWEGTIVRAVLGRYQSSTPLMDGGTGIGANLDFSYLDGY